MYTDTAFILVSSHVYLVVVVAAAACFWQVQGVSPGDGDLALLCLVAGFSAVWSAAACSVVLWLLQTQQHALRSAIVLLCHLPVAPSLCVLLVPLAAALCG